MRITVPKKIKASDEERAVLELFANLVIDSYLEDVRRIRKGEEPIYKHFWTKKQRKKIMSKPKLNPTQLIKA